MAPNIALAQTAHPQCGAEAITFDEIGPLGTRVIPLATATTTTVVSNQYVTGSANNPLPAGAGVAFSFIGGSGNFGTVYNSTRGTLGQDPDLEGVLNNGAGPTQGTGTENILIVQENNTAANPGAPDDVTGGQIIIDYELPIAEFAIRFVDFEEPAVQFEFYDNDDPGNPVIITNGQLVTGTGPYSQTGCILADGLECDINQGITTANGNGVGLIDIAKIDRVIVNMATGSASGGIDNIRVELACGTLTLAGNVFNDLDGLSDNQVDGAGTNAGGLFASLVTGGVVVASIPVANDGTYSFATVDPNTSYTVQLNISAQTIGVAPSTPDLPAGWVNTGENLGAGTGSDGTVNGLLAVNMITQSTTNANFGIVQGPPSDIGDLIFYDINGDGIFNGADSGIPGIEVQLCTDATVTDVTIAEENFSAVSYSNNSAQWATDWDEFNDNDSPIPNGQIYIAGGALNLDSDATGLQSIQRSVNLAGISGSVSLTLDYAFLPRGGGSGYDANDDVTVYILNQSLNASGDIVAGSVLATTVIDGDGVGVAGATGSETLNFTSTGAQVFVAFSVIQFNADTEVLTIDNIRLADDSVNSEVCITTTTNGSGGYLFANQLAANYTLTVDPNGTTLPNSVNPVPTADPQGALDGISNLLLAGADNLDQDFGYRPNGVFGTVTNAAGGAGLVGVVMELYTDPNGDGDPSDGVLFASTLTDTNGDYGFISIAIGDYVVVEIDPAGFSPVSDGDASADADAANVSQTDNLIPVSLVTGEQDTDNDFVDALTGLISGKVWLDEDRDGINDVEETGLTNIVVELRDGVCTPLPSLTADCPTVLTDQFGNYAFADLPAGNYDIVVDPTSLPAGITNTAGQFGLPLRSVSLASGQQVTNQKFGYIANSNTGILGDRVWSDANGDGVQDSGEAGIGNVTLSLLNSAGTTIATTTTNADGDYLFTNIPFGNDYVVVVDSADPQLAGFTPTSGPQSEGGFVSKPVTLSTSLTTVTDVDFGFDSAATLSITDRIWYDSDGDQTQDVGEPGIAAVSVNLLDSAGNIVTTTLTDNDGNFSFSGIPDGSNYRITLSDRNNQLNGLTETTTTGGDQTIGGLLSSTTDEVVDPLADNLLLNTVGDDGTPTFGYNNTNSISGTVWSDADQNTTQNSEPGISGVVVTLTPPPLVDLGNGDGVAITTTTAADGSYLFDGLPPGDYTITIGSPPTLTNTIDPDSAPGDNTAAVTLPVSSGLTEQDFGYFDSLANDIRGTVFLDTDKDGVEELNGADGIGGNADDEPGIQGVTMSLQSSEADVIGALIDINNDGVTNDTDDGVYLGYTVINGRVDLNDDGSVNGLDDGELNGVAIIDGWFDFDGNGSTSVADRPLDFGVLPAQVLATTVTDLNGDYAFSGLADGAYTVSVTDETGLLAGYDITSGLDEIDVTMVGADINDVDFGYIKDATTGSISGEVFIDESVINGLADDAETNLSGVTVYLCAAADAPCTSLNAIATTVTDVAGEYVFTNLAAGQYSVDSDPTTIPSDLDLTVDPAVVALSEGENVKNVDIGYEPATGTGVLSGFVWIDMDSDGNHDSGEAPISGVDIFVISTQTIIPVLIATGTTGADGNWLVSGISGADLQDGYIVTYDDADIPVLLESIQPTNLPLGDDLYVGVDLLSDDDNNISYLDFAFPPLVASVYGSIAGTIYSDADQNGDYAAVSDGELQGVSINLFNSSGDLVATTYSDANGAYSFIGLVDDATGYTVVVTDVANVLQDLNPLETISNPIVIVGGADITDQDAGFAADQDLGSIGNRFFFDTNGDGILQDDEPGIAGVTLQLWLDNDASSIAEQADPAAPGYVRPVPVPGIDNLVRTVTTDANGEYYFTSLPAGQYIVVVADANGFVEADDASLPTSPTAADGNAKPWSYALTKTGAAPNFAADFAVTGSNVISGKVFIEDEALVEPNLDGSVDPGVELDGSTDPTGGSNPTDLSADAPGEGVTVVLYLEQGDGTFARVESTLTDANGDYSFSGLPDGNYRVEVQPDGSVIDGFGQTGDPDLTSNALGNGDEDLVCDSPSAALCDDSTVISVTGAGATGLDFGYQKNFVTTPVTVNQFASSRDGSQVNFMWETSNEVGHLGYQLYARDADEWSLLNDELIVATDSGDALQTRRYDYSASSDARWFALVDVSAAEELTIHGPYQLGELYGAQMIEPRVFDWSGVQLTVPNQAQLSESVNSRVQALRLLDSANDDAAEYDDYSDDDEDIDDDEDSANESHAINGGQR